MLPDSTSGRIRWGSDRIEGVSGMRVKAWRSWALTRAVIFWWNDQRPTRCKVRALRSWVLPPDSFSNWLEKRGLLLAWALANLLIGILLLFDVFVVPPSVEPWIKSEFFAKVHAAFWAGPLTVLGLDKYQARLRRDAYRPGGRGAPWCLYCGHDFPPSAPPGPARCSECGRAVVVCAPDKRRPTSWKGRSRLLSGCFTRWRPRR